MSSSIEPASAQHQFFSIAELIEIFLHEAEPQVLLNCQRVCRQWKQMIEHSPQIQETLFFRPQLSTDPPRLNPMLASHFSPVFAWHNVPDSTKSAQQTMKCSYSDLESSPWARDGITSDAPARRAFSRKEASWHRMLVTQPPIARLDWFQSWECSAKDDLGTPLLHGEGHEYLNEPLTIGLLWDTVEARLLRECTVQLTFFPLGCSVEEDSSASYHEKCMMPPNGPYASRPERVYSAQQPRIRAQAHQVWPGASPSIYQEYDVPGRKWRIYSDITIVPKSEMQKQAYRRHAQSGWDWSIYDHRKDSDPRNVAASWRWSRSDAFEGLRLQQSGGTGPSGWRKRAAKRFKEEEEGSKGQDDYTLSSSAGFSARQT